MTTSEIALIDSNILVYATQTISQFYLPAKRLRDKGISGELSLCVCPQVLKEFFAVITSPKRVTHPCTPGEAITEIKKYIESKNIIKLPPREDVLDKMIALLEKYETKQQLIFDVQLVATMLSNGVTKIYTYNQEHFARFGEIEVSSP